MNWQRAVKWSEFYAKKKSRKHIVLKILSLNSFNNMPRLLPTYGILIFVGLYIYSASLYPGGSPADPNSIGFDWSNNLWCNLMSEQAINGLDNPARPVSIFAVVLLCSSMTIFFFQFAKYFEPNNTWKLIIKVTGVLAMISAVFIFTAYHDVMTTILSVCGLFGIIAIIRALHINKLTFFKVSGVLCLILIGLNNLFYYNQQFTDYLAIVQQLNFVLVLTWTIGLNLKMKNMKAAQPIK